MLSESTLLLVQISVTLLTTLMLITAAMTSEALKAQQLWAVGNVFSCLGLVVGALTRFHDLIHGAVSYALIGFGLALVLRGLRVFCGKDLPGPVLLWIPLVAFALPAYFVLVEPSLTARLIVTGLLIAALNLACAYTLLTGLPEAERRVSWICVSGFSTLALALIVRSLYLLRQPGMGLEDELTKTLAGITLYVIALAQVAISFGLIMIVTRRYSLRLQRLSFEDSMTGTYNRLALEDIGSRILARSERAGRSVALAMVDADHFKVINDTYGHLAGDLVLRHLAGCLRAQMRPMDLVARYGGEEFILLLDGMDLQVMTNAAERIRLLIDASSVPADGKEIRYQVSIGLSCSDQCGHDLWKLISVADKALYQAKNQGRNRVVAGLAVQ